jgi:hypothetical protein
MIRPSERYFVPDLSPEARSSLKKLKPRYLFVAESPHVQEVEPDAKGKRRPLCGAAGKKWWGMLAQLLGSPLDLKRTQKNSEQELDLSLRSLESFCLSHHLAVLNAVQYPLDPKVAQRFPEADPVKNLGFNKVSGPFSYKRQKDTPEVALALESLQRRLSHTAVKKLPVYALGNDSEWWVLRALVAQGEEARYAGKIPHPAAWWRRGGWFGQVAEEKLSTIFTASK